MKEQNIVAVESAVLVHSSWRCGVFYGVFCGLIAWRINPLVWNVVVERHDQVLASVWKGLDVEELVAVLSPCS